MSKMLLACNTIADELKFAIERTGFEHPVKWVDSGLHINPGSLKDKLQQELDNITGVDEVLLGFGFCGNSLVGLTSPGYRLIFPKVDDCITLLLGSRKRRKEVSAEMGTYFLTRGWLEYERNIWEEYRITVARHGKVKADKVYKIILNHYKRLGIIETGAYENSEFLEKSKLVAEDLKLMRQIIPGTLSYLEKLLSGPYDEDFVIIRPGETISLDHLMSDGSAPVLQG